MKYGKTKTKCLKYAVTSNDGHGEKNRLMILTYCLPYPKSRDAIASKNCTLSLLLLLGTKSDVTSAMALIWNRGRGLENFGQKLKF